MMQSQGQNVSAQVPTPFFTDGNATHPELRFPHLLTIHHIQFQSVEDFRLEKFTKHSFLYHLVIVMFCVLSFKKSVHIKWDFPFKQNSYRYFIISKSHVAW